MAVALARRLPGAEIVSADSRQVYRGMDIATAKPTRAELGSAPHHCLDLVDPDQRFTASDYRGAALDALTDIARRDGVALLVGGTGLYLRTIGRGFPLGGDADPAVRGRLEARMARDGLTPLVLELQDRDPGGAATIDLRNPRRVVRALERAIVTGAARPAAPVGYPAPSIWLGLSLQPEAHRRRIRARAEEHFRAGLLDEAAALHQRYPEDLPAFSAMGYREAFDVLAGRCTLPEAIERDTHRTWAYARRQRTWFRSEPGVAWLPAGEDLLAATDVLLRPWLRDIGRGDYAGWR